MQFDEHHKHLVGLLDKAYDVYASEATYETVGIVLDELIDYATFTAEEHWMKEQSYPKLDEHSEEHNRFLKILVEMQKGYHAGKLCIYIELLIYIKNWLTDSSATTAAVH